MKSDWLDAFLVFSETLNFTRAAEQLFISQPALHVKISKLSEFIGKPLYRKVGRNLVLTTEGEKLQGYSRERAEHAQAFIQELRGGDFTRPVCLCAGEGAFHYLLGDAISRYLRRSDAELRIMTGDQEKTVEAVLSGAAHLGVAALDNIPDAMMVEKLTQVEQVVVMQRTHRLAKKRLVKITDLNQMRLIVPPKNRPHRIMIDRLLMDAGVEWQRSIEVNGWELMLNFVKLGLGLAIVNSCCYIPKTLVARPLQGFPKIQFHVLRRKNTLLHTNADRLLAVLHECGDHWQSR